MTRAQRTTAGRVTAAAALSVALAVSAYVLLGSSGAYSIHARFENAGRLVKGAAVEVAGREVGTISDIGLSPDGLADIKLTIDEPSLKPLHDGTRLAIRQVGAATLANNFIELTPGSPSAPALPDGAVLSTTHTTGIVDLDAVLDTFDGRARKDVSRLIANNADVFAGSGSRYFNGMLAKFDPAFTELNGLARELASDRAELGTFIGSAARAATAIASRRADLRAALRNTARGLHGIATEHLALEDLLTRAPAVLGQATHTLADIGSASQALRPALREVPAAAKPLGPFLGGMTQLMSTAEPTLGQLVAELPQVRDSLDRFGTLAPAAVQALQTSGTAFQRSRHVLRGFRYYAPDFLIGILNGLVAIASGTFNKAGHYMHLEFAQTAQQFFGNDVGRLLGAQPLVPGTIGIRNGLVARCPGGTAPPAPDFSSPYIPNKTICNPADDMPASVNQP